MFVPRSLHAPASLSFTTVFLFGKRCAPYLVRFMLYDGGDHNMDVLSYNGTWSTVGRAQRGRLNAS